MKKELIGFSVCMMLMTIAFVPNISADEDIEPMMSLSEEEYIELNDKLLALNDQLLAAVTLEQVETAIRNMVIFLIDYGLLPADTNVDDEVDLMKNSYVEQIQNQPENTVMLEEETQEEFIESTLMFSQPLSMSPGWLLLMPWSKKPIGFQIAGAAAYAEPFLTKNINKRRVSGYVQFLLFGQPIFRGTLSDYEYSFVHWYLVFGFGTFDVTCKYKWNDQWYEVLIGRFIVNGLQVSLEDYGASLQGSPASQTQPSTELDVQSIEQLIDTTQQYAGSTTNN